MALHDVTAHSLGIMTAGGGFDALIPIDGRRCPPRCEEVFSTSRDHQTTVKIVVLQGESESGRAPRHDALGPLRPHRAAARGGGRRPVSR